ncbi:MAG TPA: thiamine pyrophosphate-binding protein [Dehalococcoidia bacterium]
MSQIDGGEILVRMLERANLRVVFTLHGGHLDSVYMAARAHGFQLVDTRHEQAAVQAGDGWARTTGQPGVAIVTAGPGVVDAVSGVVNAYVDAIPMLLIGGAPPASEDERLTLAGGFDQVALMRPVTKWAHRIQDVSRIADLVAQAIRMATTGRPGPVYLELPIDVAFGTLDEAKAFLPDNIAPDAAPGPSAESVETAVDWLSQAERPAIIAGGGAWFSGAAADLLAFAEQTQTPVFSNGRAHGMVPADHPLCGRGVLNLALLNMTGAGAPDVVLLLGARLGLFTGGGSGRVLPRSTRLIQVDIEGAEIGRERNVDLGIVADCREALRAFSASANGRTWPDRAAWTAASRQASEVHRVMFAQALTADAAPIHPYRLADAVVQAVGRDAVVVADGGETSIWMETVSQIYEGGHWLSHGYLAQLGTGMPFAIAAQVAHPGRRVVCVVGDGSVGFNFAEFDTMVRHGLPVVVVINNDAQWGMSAHGQDMIYGKGKRVVTDLAKTRYDLAAAGFGAHPEHVTEPQDLVPALERALASGLPACVNVMTDPTVVSPVTTALVEAASEAGLAGEAEGARYLP